MTEPVFSQVKRCGQCGARVAAHAPEACGACGASPTAAIWVTAIPSRPKQQSMPMLGKAAICGAVVLMGLDQWGAYKDRTSSEQRHGGEQASRVEPEKISEKADSEPVERGLGYVGKIVGPSQVPLVTDPSDFKTLQIGDKQGMADLARDGKLMIAAPGMACMIIERNWTGLVKVRFLKGRLEGEAGWVPYQMVQ